MAVGTVFLFLVPYILKLTLDAIAAGDASFWEVLLPAAAGIVTFNALHGLFTYLRGRWAAQASEGIVRQLRHQLYAHLERLPCAYHDKADTGDLVRVVLRTWKRCACFFRRRSSRSPASRCSY